MEKEKKKAGIAGILRSKYARSFVKKYKWSYLIGIAVLILIDVLQTEVPLVVGETIDQVALGGFTADMVWKPVIRLAIIAAVVFIGRIVWRWFIFGSARKIERDMRNELYSHLQTLSASYFHEHKAGESAPLKMNARGQHGSHAVSHDKNPVRIYTGIFAQKFCCQDGVFNGLFFYGQRGAFVPQQLPTVGKGTLVITDRSDAIFGKPFCYIFKRS